MVEDISKCRGKRSPNLRETLQMFHCTRPRTTFFILLVSSVLLFYYVNLIKVSEVWSDTVQMLYNSTYKSANVDSLSEADRQWISAFIAERKTNLSLVNSSAGKCAEETTFHVAYPCNYSFILNEPERCRADKPFLVLMVPVAPKNREARDAVRSTWGTERMVMGKVVSLFFLLGESQPEGREEMNKGILEESENYHDIIQSDFLDSYKNLTIKTMVIMEWLAAYCRNAVYGMKIDSDMFLNVNNLVKMLIQAPRKSYMTGLVAKGGMVLRDPTSKWFLPKNVFAEDFFPPYALGLGYVVSLDLPSKLVEGSKGVRAVYIEDVYLGLCMRHLGIPYTFQEDQGLFNVIPLPYNRCVFSKIIATTTFGMNDQVYAWKDLKKPGPPC